MKLNEQVVLGRTGLSVGRLGISSSFGAPCAAFELAFEKGCNYFTWGTFIKGRSPEMKKALLNIIAKGQRDKLVISMYTYAHNAFLTEKCYLKGLRELGIDYADVLLLGYFSRRPGQSLIDGALRIKEKGWVRHIGISGHNRKLFAPLAAENTFDVLHLRYNAAHRGAETDVFPHLAKENRPGIVSFTATRWRQLLNPKKMPPGERPATAAECYHFVLSNPNIDVCMMGTRSLEQMQENLNVLDMTTMSTEELQRMRKIGDFLHG
jgi:aryl-alcohol dehydrogenase-like predicted oxidoreductase